MRLKQIVEALLFASPEPLDLRRLLALLADEGVERKELEEALAELAADYRLSALELVRVASGWRFQVRRELAPWVSRLFPEKAGHYSRAVLETLAIIAYRQPITRGEIEAIRGVAVSSSVLNTLKERGWIRVVGHKEVPGRPALLATTERFLDDFNLDSLSQLPPLSDVEASEPLLKSPV
ncbi:SMC-Scp complex subunit ScpB [Methylothermus subterraneus]